MSRPCDAADPKPKTVVGMLQGVAPKVRRSDDDLKRYYAYRCAVWKSLNPDVDWKVLATKLGIDPAAFVAFHKGRNGSFQKIGAFSRALGPDSEDEFKQLARAWAEKYPAWNPEKDPLPDRIEFTGDALIDGAEASPMYSDELRAAVRALPGLMQCTPEEAKLAGERAWKADADTISDWHEWLGALRRELVRLRRESGERPSVKLKSV